MFSQELLNWIQLNKCSMYIKKIIFSLFLYLCFGQQGNFNGDKRRNIQIQNEDKVVFPMISPSPVWHVLFFGIIFAALPTIWKCEIGYLSIAYFRYFEVHKLTAFIRKLIDVRCEFHWKFEIHHFALQYMSVLESIGFWFTILSNTSSRSRRKRVGPLSTSPY